MATGDGLQARMNQVLPEHVKQQQIPKNGGMANLPEPVSSQASGVN